MAKLISGQIMIDRLGRCQAEPQQATATLLILLRRLGVKPAEQLTTRLDDGLYAYGWKTSSFVRKMIKKGLCKSYEMV